MSEILLKLRALERRIESLETQEPLHRSDLSLSKSAMHTLAVNHPLIRGVWLTANAVAGTSTLYDSTPIGLDLTSSSGSSPQGQSGTLRYLTFGGSLAYSRAYEAVMNNGTISGMAWVYKDVAATQFSILSRDAALLPNTNSAFWFGHGSGDNINITVTNSTTRTSLTRSAPIDEWYFAGFSFSTSTTTARVYLGTSAGWQGYVEDTGFPSGINTASSTPLVIGATADSGLTGFTHYAQGNMAVVTFSHTASNETQMRNYYENTKSMFYGQ